MTFTFTGTSTTISFTATTTLSFAMITVTITGPLSITLPITVSFPISLFLTFTLSVPIMIPLPISLFLTVTLSLTIFLTLIWLFRLPAYKLWLRKEHLFTKAQIKKVQAHQQQAKEKKLHFPAPNTYHKVLQNKIRWLAKRNWESTCITADNYWMLNTTLQKDCCQNMQLNKRGRDHRSTCPSGICISCLVPE